MSSAICAFIITDDSVGDVSVILGKRDGDDVAPDSGAGGPLPVWLVHVTLFFRRFAEILYSDDISMDVVQSSQTISRGVCPRLIRMPYDALSRDVLTGCVLAPHSVFALKIRSYMSHSARGSTCRTGPRHLGRSEPCGNGNDHMLGLYDYDSFAPSVALVRRYALIASEALHTVC
jgi:hypothetical protein